MGRAAPRAGVADRQGRHPDGLPGLARGRHQCERRSHPAVPVTPWTRPGSPATPPLRHDRVQGVLGDGCRHAILARGAGLERSLELRQAHVPGFSLRRLELRHQAFRLTTPSCSAPVQAVRVRHNQFSGQQAAFGSVRYLNQVKRFPSRRFRRVRRRRPRGRRVNSSTRPRHTGTLWSTAAFLGADTSSGHVIGAGFSPGGYRSVFLLVEVP